MIIAVVLTYIVCAMLAAGIYGYRNPPDHSGGELLGVILMAPLGLTYQSGMLIREVKHGQSNRR